METLANTIANYLNTSITLALLTAYAAGVLTSFTPCVYPLIPITASYISSKNLKQKSKFSALILSLMYVLGMALIYAGLGIFAALTGKIFGSVSTSPIAMLIVGNIMILLGLGMLDVFILQTPSFLQPKQNQNQRSGLLGALIIGMVSGLVVAPCTAPPLGVLLTFAASKQNIFLGGLLLFVFAYGMGTLLILVGTFSGAVAVLPKSGKWMVAIKKSLAAVMLIIGEYFIFKAGQAWF